MNKILKQTLYDKLWDAHVIDARNDGMALLYIDRHLVHEVTSPQAFDGLRQAKRKMRHPQKTLAVADHNIPTRCIQAPIANIEARTQLETLTKNAQEFGIELYPLGHNYNGVCHVVAPELGFVLPGITLVCGDSHTATHGAFGSMAFGIGTSEVEHTFATQTLLKKKMKNMRITITGSLQKYVTPKDIILYVIKTIGTAGGTGYVIEYAGSIIENMSMEGRMTVCNMTIEAGACIGLIAPDETTFAYLRNKQKAPKEKNWDAAVKYWKTLRTDEGACFDKEIAVDVTQLEPQVTWGTSPEDVISINDVISEPISESKKRSLSYMGLIANTPICGIKINRVFIGSCTNGRIEDLRDAASVINGKRVAKDVVAIVVPGSNMVKKQAEKEGLDKIFKDAGFEWRHPGCSMCLAMNDDKALSGERVASTSNRNFEGRQGRGSRTHLMSPVMAAATAIAGRIANLGEII